MKKEELKIIKNHLETLYSDYCLAENWQDKRSKNCKIREARSAISDYAKTLSPEILGLFDTEVNVDALSSQFAGEDIGPCINVLENLIK